MSNYRWLNACKDSIKSQPDKKGKTVNSRPIYDDHIIVNTTTLGGTYDDDHTGVVADPSNKPAMVQHDIDLIKQSWEQENRKKSLFFSSFIQKPKEKN